MKPFWPPEASVRPSALNASVDTCAPSSPVTWVGGAGGALRSQTPTVPNRPPQASQRPSGLYASAETQLDGSAGGIRLIWRVARSRMLTLPAVSPAATARPPVANASVFTVLPLTTTGSPCAVDESTSQSARELGPPIVARTRSSGLKANSLVA